MDLVKNDEGLKTLLESGRDKGYLTYSQVNEYLPDDAVNPEKLDQLLLLLEEQGIELIDESEAEEREAGPGAAAEVDVRDLELTFIAEEDRRRLRRNVKIRRRKAVTLVEELSIRTQKVQPLMKKLEQISGRMDELEQQIEALKGMRSAREDRANLEKEMRDLMLMTLEDALSLRRRVEAMKKRF